MPRIPWIRATIAAVSILVLPGVAVPQPRTDEPTQVPPPGPVPPPTAPAPQPTPQQPQQAPPAPAGPDVPAPPPTAKEEPEPVPGPEITAEPQLVPEERVLTREPTLLGPSVFVGPDLFNPPPPQGWLSITPSLTLSGEFNDNVELESSGKASDFFIAFIPGVTVSVQRPRYRLLAGYYVSGDFSTRDGDFDFGSRHRFFADLSYAITPHLQFTLSDGLVKDRDTNTVTTSASATAGRRDAFRNTLTPRLRWQATPSTGFGLFASYSLLRFEDTNDGSQSSSRDSDTYRLGVDADHRLTARLTGSLDFAAAYLDVEDQPTTRTYTPRAGLSYEVTPTLRASASAGPSFIDIDGDNEIRPAVSATLAQLFKFGSVRIGYRRAVIAEGDGPAEEQSVFASLIVPTLVRGLQFSFTPRYSMIERDLTRDETTDRNVLTLNLRATYQLARNISLIGSYTFFKQTEDRQGDIDQNRVFFGIQYAFPINFY
jgi:predicted porin